MARKFCFRLEWDKLALSYKLRTERALRLVSFTADSTSLSANAVERASVFGLSRSTILQPGKVSSGILEE
jgi:hypothetical protein